MTRVDGITPPKKNNKKPIKRKVVKKIRALETENKLKQLPVKKIESNTEFQKKYKHTTVWLISFIIVFILFIIWSTTLFSGKLISPKNENNESFLNKFSQEINQIWDKFQKDYLKIKKKETQTPQTEEERIKELEEKVFPDFDQYK